MSAVKKAAKLSFFIFSFLVLIFVVGGIYLYMNVNGIAKEISEKVASNALGVAVTIDDMDVSVSDKLVVVRGIRVANPDGYNKPYAMEIAKVTVAAESFSRALLHFKDVKVDGTVVHLEVRPRGTNLGDIKKNIDARQEAAGSAGPGAQDADKSEPVTKDMNVIIDHFVMSESAIIPTTTLVHKDLARVNMANVRLKDIGTAERGIKPKAAIRLIMEEMLVAMNKSANTAGFLEGLSLEIVNGLGVNTLEVFQKNLKKSYENEVEGFKKGFESLKKAFE